MLTRSERSPNRLWNASVMSRKSVAEKVFSKLWAPCLLTMSIVLLCSHSDRIGYP
jgi:hypothetical protein